MSKKAETKTTATGTTMSRKITMKELCCGDVKAAKAGYIGRVTGIANDIVIGETQYGPWTKLKGQFIGQNADGQKFVSGFCILPEPGNGLVAGQLMSDEITEVKFSFDIYKVLDESIAVGYQFKTDAVLDVAQNDMLENLVASLPALPAPEK
jgi:hypothetical protein